MIAVYKINISLLKRLLKFACFCVCVCGSRRHIAYVRLPVGVLPDAGRRIGTFSRSNQTQSASHANNFSCRCLDHEIPAVKRQA